MSGDDARIFELAEQAMESGRRAEEVCADFPELLESVKERLEWCRGVDQMVEQLFPSTVSAKQRLTMEAQETPLPSIPGYEVLDVIGRGGIGIIYRARQLKLHRVVALKMLLTGQYATPAELARFRCETLSIAALQHPNVVQIYDVGEVEG